MSPPDQASPPLFSGYLASHASGTRWRAVLATLAAGILILVLSLWLVPIGSLLLCLAGGLLVLCGRRKRWARRYGGVVSTAAAVPVLVDVVLHGRPAVWWLLGGTGVALAAHYIRPPEISIWRILLTNIRNAVLSAALGLTSVLVMQLALHYIRERREALARDWTLQIGEARAWLEEIVLLGPTQLAVLLSLLVVTAIIAPSLNVIRNYRRVALIASHGLLALIVATSFMFFGNSYSRSAEWIARISAAKEHLGAIDKSHKDVVKAAVMKRSIVKLDSYQRKALIALSQEIAKYPQRDEVSRQVAAELISSSSRNELARQAELARQQIEKIEPTDEHRRSQEVIEHARQQVERSESPSRQELAALKIERTRAAARRLEALAAIQQFFTDTLCPPLVGEMVQSTIDVIVVRGRVPPTNRATATSATDHAGAEPPHVSFDHVLPRNPAHDPSDLDLFLQIPILVQRTDLKIREERQLAKNAAERLRSQSSLWRRWFGGGKWFGGGGGGSSGGRRFNGGTTRSRGGSRFGVRGGGPLLTA